jgi:hypothetical protein
MGAWLECATLVRFSRAMAAACFLLSSFLTVSSVAAANCQFVFGFKAMHDLIPQIVGDCLVDEHHGANGGARLRPRLGRERNPFLRNLLHPQNNLQIAPPLLARNRHRRLVTNRVDESLVFGQHGPV